MLRNELKMSRRAFGEALGVSGDVINNIENNRLKQPEQKEPIYKLICKEFNVNKTWLKTGEGEMFVQSLEEDEFAKYISEILIGTNNKVYNAIKSFMLVYGRLNDDSKKLLNDILDSLITEIKKEQN